MWSEKSFFASPRLRIRSTMTFSPTEDLPPVRLKVYSTSAQFSP